MVAPPSKLKVFISAALIIAAMVFLTIMTTLTPPQQPVLLYPENTPAAIHITQNGDITTPASYNQTPPIERNEDKYIFTGDISALLVVDKSNIVIDGGGFGVATTFQLGRGSPGYGLKLLSVFNVTVENVNSPLGIELELSKNCTIANSAAVVVYQSSNNIVSNCTGSTLSYAQNNTIIHSTSNEFDVEYSNSNYILYNNCTGPGRSILLWDSSKNVLFGNVFSKCLVVDRHRR